ncbi:MAG TPA: hypothetical protein VNU68_07185 [Verrucomicrobiae bacterium]|nr:hypothetical protein [Verrucomicrobiae bacterium]
MTCHTHELRILGAAGDVKITWNHDDQADRAKARAEVARLKAAGYLFFLLDGSPADEVSSGNGELVAHIASDEEIIAPEPAETPAEPEVRRGRPKGAVKKAIAVKPMRGG